MPRGRRHQSGQAAGSLAASRLPLGTPSFIHDTDPEQRRQSIYTLVGDPGEAVSYSARSCVDSDTATDKLDSHGGSSSSHIDPIMASTHSDTNEQTLSLAAAKLERQKRRIEDTNAALSAQFPSEKQKQTARSKGKAWKPFDFATEINAAAHPPLASAPVVETRVNVFRASSQGVSSSRPVSRLSSHTQNSTASESERRDSQFLESDDFQLFLGRRKSRPAVPTFDDKPSAQNATVEATFNKRDITEVFGNELPRSGFMDGNPGTVDGQLQFIQHPNGDVSAHQWSSSRFGWENIGQFSNIRKKIEGQLAADRLKGETAWQSLQQNTLAYFRTVAKQREADVMRLPFGVKEIAACLPDTRVPSAAPTGPRRITSKVEMPERPETMMPREDFQSARPSISHRESSAAVPAKSTSDSLPQHQRPPSQLNPRFDPTLNFTPTPSEHVRENHFTSTNPSGAAYLPRVTAYDPSLYYHPGLQNMPHAYVRKMTWMALQQQPPHAWPGIKSGYDYYKEQRTRDKETHQQTREQFAQSVTQQARQQSNPRRQVQAHFPSSNYQALPIDIQSHHALSATGDSTASAEQKAATTLDTRTAMREHVMKMGEHAKERTKSQANIGRTVLYDPFQDQDQKKHIPSEPAKQEALAVSNFQGEALGHFTSLGLSMIPGLGAFSSNGQDPFPTALVPSVKLPREDAFVGVAQYRSLPSQTSGLSECDLRDSSPDREWGPRSLDHSQEPPMPINHTPFLKQWDTEQLDEWLWSGNKFARQEDFHQRIMATDAVPTRRTHSTSANTNPIAPPSRFKPQPPTVPAQSQSAYISSPSPKSNILTNRLLVPVLENLASYVQGPVEKRRDYFCPWVKAPDWAIDRSANGNDSFFDSQWGQPPARVGRDPRYQPLPRGLDVRFGNFDAPMGGHTVAMPMPGLDRRFGYSGRF